MTGRPQFGHHLTMGFCLRKWVFLSLLILFGMGVLFAIADTSLSGRLVWSLTQSDRRPSTPNVILIVVDSLRADHLNQYGYERETSPDLDALSEQSLRFEKAFAPTSWGPPSTASILSGLHPKRHNMTRHTDTLGHKVETLAELLQDVGYDTAAFSYSTLITPNANFHQGFDLFVSPKHRRLTHYAHVSEMVGEVERFLDYHGREKPFFLYLHPMNCHGPYRVPQDRRQTLVKKISRRFRYNGSIMKGIMSRGKVELRGEVNRTYIQSLVDQYDTAIRYTTDELSVLFRKLKQDRMWENSVVVLTANHGEELFDHGGFSHGYTLFNEVVRVPLMIKLPYQARGGVEKHPVSVIDLYPTIAAAVDVSLDEKVDGRSLLPFFGKVNVDERIEVPEIGSGLKHRDLLLQLDRGKRGVMTGMINRDTKYVSVERDYAGQKDAELLFDLRRDRKERRNLMDKRAKDAAALRKRMTRREAALGKMALKTRPMYVLSQKELKALGYVK